MILNLFIGTLFVDDKKYDVHEYTGCGSSTHHEQMVLQEWSYKHVAYFVYTCSQRDSSPVDDSCAAIDFGCRVWCFLLYADVATPEASPPQTKS